mgnify:CR=1 FL=1|tara:strand:- start:569 stop:748 length:180 start_codon:yes stop_codon:yes gene_type:complete
MMEVVATRKVCYNGTWYNSGDAFDCNPKDFNGLEAAGVEAVKGKSKAKLDKAAKNIKTR